MPLPALADQASPPPGLSPHALLTALGRQPLMVDEAFFDSFVASLLRGDAHAQAPATAEPLQMSSFAGAYDRQSRYNVTDDGIAIIPVQGLLVDRGPWLGMVWGMTSYEGLAEQLKRATADTAIKRIVLDVDSGGGMVAGIWDLMPVIDAAKKAKPVVALANSFAASAAYAIACAADKLYVNRSSLTGSIGVVRPHYDMTAALEKWGVKVTMFKAGAYKTAGSQSEPLTADTSAYIQAGIDEAMAAFVGHVATYRGLDPAAVIDTQARIYGAADAVSLGLADGILSFEELLENVRTASTPPARKRAQSPGASKMSTNPGSASLSEADTARIAAGVAEVLAAKDAAKDAAAKAAAAAAAAPAAVDPKAAAEAAVAADRARVAAVLALPEAKGRESAAMKLALRGLDAAAAKDILADLPVAGAANPLAAAMENAANSAGVRPEAGSAANGTGKVKASMADLVKSRVAKATK